MKEFSGEKLAWFSKAVELAKDFRDRVQAIREEHREIHAALNGSHTDHATTLFAKLYADNPSLQEAADRISGQFPPEPGHAWVPLSALEQDAGYHYDNDLASIGDNNAERISAVDELASQLRWSKPYVLPASHFMEKAEAWETAREKLKTASVEDKAAAWDEICARYAAECASRIEMGRDAEVEMARHQEVDLDPD